MSHNQKLSRGFSLIELLCVVAVMSVMGGVLAMSLGGFRSTSERKQAIETIMGTMEQARVTALQSGNNVHVILALSRDSGASEDALLILGEPPLGSTNSSKVVYTRWVRLPKIVRFRSATETLAVNDLPSGIQTSMLPRINGNPTYSGFTYNSTGQVEYPPDGNLILALYEGMRSSDGTEKARGATAQATQGLSDAGLYDVIRLSRYTGRVRTEMSSLLLK